MRKDLCEGSTGAALTRFAGRAYGRVVWMPTADAHTQEAAGLPRLCGPPSRLARHSYAVPPVEVNVEDAVRQVCHLVAEADAVLAT
jgi:hypothetical protein